MRHAVTAIDTYDTKLCKIECICYLHSFINEPLNVELNQMTLMPCEA